MKMITWAHDLTNGSVEKVLRQHFNDPGLKVVSATDSEMFLTANDHYNSEIKKLSVVFHRSNEGRIEIATRECVRFPLLGTAM